MCQQVENKDGIEIKTVVGNVIYLYNFGWQICVVFFFKSLENLNIISCHYSAKIVTGYFATTITIAVIYNLLLYPVL